MRFSNSRLPMVAAVIGLSLACGTSDPEPAVTLDYEPTRWLLTGAINVDALAEGASISLSLEEGGLVDGSLFMPASVTGSSELTTRLAGNWVKQGDTIRFNQITETFVSELPWILSPETLIAADSFEGSFYDVVLTRIFE